MGVRNPTVRMMAMTGGLWIWAAQFTFIYGFTALACARGFADGGIVGFNIVRFAIVVVTLAALALTAAILVQALVGSRTIGPDDGPSERFIKSSAVWIAGLSLLAIAWSGLPALIVPICPG
jgi:hypothetical protein